MPAGGGAVSVAPAAGGGAAAPATEEKKEEKEEEKVCVWLCDRVRVSKKSNRKNPTKIWASDCSTRKHETVLFLHKNEYIFIFETKTCFDYVAGGEMDQNEHVDYVPADR